MNRKHFTTLVLGKLLAETFAESVMKRPIYHGISSILSSLPHEIATCRRQFVLFFSLSRSASLFVPLHDFLQSRRCEFGRKKSRNAQKLSGLQRFPTDYIETRSDNKHHSASQQHQSRTTSSKISLTI